MSDETRENGPAAVDETTKKSDESRVMARRFFLKAALYAAPAVATVVSVQHGSAQFSGCAACDAYAGNCGGAPGYCTDGSCPSSPCP